MKNILYISILAIAITLSIVSCDREPVAPPARQVDYVTIEQLRAMHKSGVTDTVKTDVYIQGVVTLTPELGNVPGMIAYIQDSTDAICLTVSDNTNTLAMDSEVKILCYGVIFEEYNGLLQFGSNNSLSIAANIEVVNLIASIDPDTVTIGQLNTGDYEGRYVYIPGVQFDAAGTFSGNQVLADCNSQIDVYTRSAATFSGQTKPTGNGYLKGISSIYNDQQILLRDPSEMEMTGTRCDEPTTIYLSENFSGLANGNNVNLLPGWMNYPEAGLKTWYAGVFTSSGDVYVKASAYQSTEASTIIWMVTPAIDLTGAISPYISFTSCNGKDNGATLQLFVSTDYNGSATPWTSTWTELAFTRPPLNATGWSDFVNSGQVDLSTYKGNQVRIAWVYKGSSTLTTAWEVDNVLVAE